jgi:hypothetical protein
MNRIADVPFDKVIGMSQCADGAFRLAYHYASPFFVEIYSDRNMEHLLQQ